MDFGELSHLLYLPGPILKERKLVGTAQRSKSREKCNLRDIALFASKAKINFFLKTYSDGAALNVLTESEDFTK